MTASVLIVPQRRRMMTHKEKCLMLLRAEYEGATEEELQQMIIGLFGEGRILGRNCAISDHSIENCMTASLHTTVENIYRGRYPFSLWKFAIPVPKGHVGNSLLPYWLIN